MADRKTETTWDGMLAWAEASRRTTAPAIASGPADAGKRSLLSEVLARVAGGPTGNDPVVGYAAPVEWVFDSAKTA